MPIDSISSSSFITAQEVLQALPEAIREAHSEASAEPGTQPDSQAATPQSTATSSSWEPASPQLQEARQLVTDFLRGDCEPSQLIDEIALLVVDDLLADLGAVDFPGLREHILETARHDPTVLSEIGAILRDIARTLPASAPP